MHNPWCGINDEEVCVGRTIDREETGPVVVPVRESANRYLMPEQGARLGRRAASWEGGPTGGSEQPVSGRGSPWRSGGGVPGAEEGLNGEQRAEARTRVAAGEQKAAAARAYGISRETLYQYLRAVE